MKPLHKFTTSSWKPAAGRALRLAAGLAMIGAMAGAAAPVVPTVMQYSGVLWNNAGQPVASGDYRIAMRIYDQNSVVQWGALYSVHVDDTGRFGLLLGAPGGIALPDAPAGATLVTALSNAPCTIGLTVMSDVNGHPLAASREMSPRQALLSVPYAIAAQTAQSAAALNATAGGAPTLAASNLTLHGSMQCMGTPYIIVTNKCDLFGNNCTGSGTAATDGFLMIQYESSSDFGTILVNGYTCVAFSNSCCSSSVTPRNQGWMVLPLNAGATWQVQGHPAWLQVWWLPLDRTGAPGASANVPAQMDYQGQLLAPTNSAAAGDYLTRLRIYDQNNRVVWGSSNVVHVRPDGSFNVAMGNGVGAWDPLSQNTDFLQAFQATPRNLGLAPMTDQNGRAVTNVADILPLQPLLSAPFAFQAGSAANTLSLSNPAGPVVLNGNIQCAAGLNNPAVQTVQWLGAMNTTTYPLNAWNLAPCDGFILIPYSDPSHNGSLVLSHAQAPPYILQWSYAVYTANYAGWFMFPIPAGLSWQVAGTTAGNLVYWIPWSR